MVDNAIVSLRSFLSNLNKRGSVLTWLNQHIAIVIAILLSLVIAVFFLGRNLFDSSVPIEGDVRSHIFKIELLQNYLANLSWPQWNPYWYHGIPEDQFYPPGFYFLCALLSFIVPGVVAYKILILITLMLNGLAIYYFARRFLKFDSHLAIWCLLIYETSTPLLINFMFGEGPNLLGWAATIGFLTVYLSQVMENKTAGLLNKLLPGVMLGVAILVHPFPVLFAAMVLVIFYVIWLLHKRSWRGFLQDQLPYLISVSVIGALIGMYYWLPAILTLNHSSPIYSFTRYMWPGGIIYLLVIIFLAIAVTIGTRHRLRGDIKLDLIVISLFLASALGFGATNYLPFGLGSLVQEFRFATIVIPFFGILIILYPLKYREINFTMSKLVTAALVGIIVAVFAFGVDNREALIAGFQDISNPGLSSFYALFSEQFSGSFPSFAIAILPYVIAILFLVLSISPEVMEISKSKPLYILTAGACLLAAASIIPYINTNNSSRLSNLYEYVDNYTTPEYAQIMESIQEGRLIVPMGRGYLTEGDNPVTFARRWNVETVNGPYNQGDPKFFKISVHLEWEERFLNNLYTRENLMNESAARYIFIRNGFALPSSRVGLQTKVANEYGKLLELNQDVSYANQVTPVLIDVDKPRELTEFFNILLPKGYKLVFVEVNDISPDLISKFENVMVDHESKASNYPGKTTFLLTESSKPDIIKDQNMVKVNVPYLTYTNQIFYHGDEANGYLWSAWDRSSKARITRQMQNALNKTSELMTEYIDSLDYTPVGYEMVDTRIDLESSPGFTLVKNSYFPYWKANHGTVMATTQGFMLVHTDGSDATLNFRKPFYYIFAAVCTVVTLTVFMIVLIIGLVRRSRSN